MRLPIQSIGKLILWNAPSSFSWMAGNRRHICRWLTAIFVSAESWITGQVRFRLGMFRLGFLWIFPQQIILGLLVLMKWFYACTRSNNSRLPTYSEGIEKVTFQFFVQLIHKTAQKLLGIMLLKSTKHQKHLIQTKKHWKTFKTYATLQWYVNTSFTA